MLNFVLWAASNKYLKQVFALGDKLLKENCKLSSCVEFALVQGIEYQSSPRVAVDHFNQDSFVKLDLRGFLNAFPIPGQFI